MSAKDHGLDAFERSLKDSLDQFEVPYNSADWSQMERTLNGGRQGWWLGGLGLSVIAAGALLVGGGAWYAFAHDAQAKGTVATATVPEAQSPRSLDASANQAQVVVPSQTAPGTAPALVAAATPGKAPEEQPEKSVSTTVARTTTGTPTATVKDNATGTTTTGGAAAAGASPSAEKNTFTASISEGCAGTSVEFKVSHMPEDGIYLWNFGDGSFSNKANPEHTFTKPGSYQVMLSMSAVGVGSIQNKPSSDMIVIHDAPTASFNVLKQEYDGHLPSVHFENRSLAGKKYSWDFGDGQTSSIPHPDHIYKKKGVYQVELTVTNEIGCVDQVMKDVRIDKDYNLDAPESFSPDGDGSEETFIPEALRTLGVKFNLTVYSPNGTLLYQTNDATKPWTGRPNNRGDICGAGEYVWVVDVRESLHLAETYTGKVRLVP